MTLRGGTLNGRREARPLRSGPLAGRGDTTLAGDQSAAVGKCQQSCADAYKSGGDVEPFIRLEVGAPSDRLIFIGYIH